MSHREEYKTELDRHLGLAAQSLRAIKEEGGQRDGEGSGSC